ncbi:hypothetical protein EX30DRAFT_380704 [Ascodesmis nigricans]|uniref:Uncharacterized protein n=1 Tax=Ascodesmis nigricans TaxID=341454 RepID=A0A4S2N3D7_9PEZI|nr:hypothetical protein EX30DRAFT_380704 [Ascodesmis nigricans]
MAKPKPVPELVVEDMEATRLRVQRSWEDVGKICPESRIFHFRLEDCLVQAPDSMSPTKIKAFIRRGDSTAQSYIGLTLVSLIADPSTPGAESDGDNLSSDSEPAEFHGRHFTFIIDTHDDDPRQPNSKESNVTQPQTVTSSLQPIQHHALHMTASCLPPAGSNTQ